MTTGKTIRKQELEKLYIMARQLTNKINTWNNLDKEQFISKCIYTYGGSEVEALITCCFNYLVY